MKLRNKFTAYNIIILITPIALIGVISTCFFVIFIMKFPVEQLNITRASLLAPSVFSQALGEFFKSNPEAILYFVLWFLICIVVLVVSTTIVTYKMSRSIEVPIKELTQAADNIRAGKLDFEVMGSEYDDIDRLCTNFDNMRKELIRADEREKYMTRERSMLLANISHDIKTPITSIKGYVDGIRDGVAASPEKLADYLDTIYRKAESIDSMLNDLSAYSKMELSNMDFHLQTGDLNEFLRGFTDDYTLDLEKRGVKFIKNISSEKALIRLDYEKLLSFF